MLLKKLVLTTRVKKTHKIKQKRSQQIWHQILYWSFKHFCSSFKSIYGLTMTDHTTENSI